MSNSFFIPGDSKYHNQGLIFSQRVNSTEKYKNSINCPKAFTTSTRIKEKLGLNPIKKIRIIKKCLLYKPFCLFCQDFFYFFYTVEKNAWLFEKIIIFVCCFECAAMAKLVDA